MHRPSSSGIPMQGFTCPHCFMPCFFSEPAALSRPLFEGSSFGAPVALSKPPLGSSAFGAPVALSKPLLGSSAFAPVELSKSPLGSSAFGAPVALSKPPLGGSAFGAPEALSKPPLGSSAFVPVALSKPPLGGSAFGAPEVFSRPHESSPKSACNNTAHVVKLPRERLRSDHHESFERATPYLRTLYEEFVQNPKVTLQRTFSRERMRSEAANAAIKGLDDISGGMQWREMSHAGGEKGPSCIYWEKFGEIWELVFNPIPLSDRQEVEKLVEEKLLNLVERFAYPYGWAKLPPHYP